MGAKKGGILALIPVLIATVAVAAAGYFYIQNHRLQETAKPLEISPFSNETADWKTYANTEVGLTFKYPPAYDPPKESTQLISLISPLSPDRSKGYNVQSGELKIEIWYEPAKANDSSEKCFRDHTTDSKVLSQSEITISGLKGTKFLWEGMGVGETTCIINNSTRYIIVKYPAETTRQKEFDQILSTFKFTATTTGAPAPPPSELPSETLVYKARGGWQTYTDPAYGFSIQYPQNHRLSTPTPEGTRMAVTVCRDTETVKNLCTPSFLIQVFNDYNGGSRREWLTKKFSVTQPYYMDWVIDKHNALVAIEGNPGGSSGLFVAIPNGTTMILYSSYFVSWDPDTGKLPDLSFHNQILSSFKFID